MRSLFKQFLVLGLCAALHTASVAGLVVPKAAGHSDRFGLDLHYNLSSGTTIVSTHGDLRGKNLGHDRQDAIEIQPAKRSFLDRFWAVASNALPKRWPGGGRNDRRPTKAEMKWPIHGDSSVVGPSCKHDVAPEIGATREAELLSKRLPPLAPDFDFDGDGFPNGGDYLLGGAEKRDVAAAKQDTSEAELMSRRNPPLAPDFDFDSLPYKGGPGYLVGISKRDAEVSSPSDLLGGEEKRDVVANGDGDTNVNVNVILQQGGDPCNGPECSGKPSVVVYTSTAGASMSDHTAAESPKSFVTLTTFVTASKETSPSSASTHSTSSSMSKVVKTILRTIEPESDPCSSARTSTTSTTPTTTSKIVKTILSTVEPESTTPCPTVATSTKTSKIVTTILDTTVSTSCPSSSGSTAIVTMTTLPTHIDTAPGTVVVTMTTIPVPSSPSKTVKTILTTLEPSTTTSCPSKTSASLTAPTAGYPMKLCEVDNIFGKYGWTKPKWVPDDGKPGNKCPWEGHKAYKPSHHKWRRCARSVAAVFRGRGSVDSVTMKERDMDAESVSSHGDQLFHSEPELVGEERIVPRDSLAKPSKCPLGAKLIKLHPHCKTKSNCIGLPKGTCLYPNGTSVHVPDPKHVLPQPVQSADAVSARAAPATVEQHIAPREILPDIPAGPRCPPNATFTTVNMRCRRCPSFMGLPRCVYRNGTTVPTSTGQLNLNKPAQTTARNPPIPAPATEE